jgi:hypothetical protein
LAAGWRALGEEGIKTMNTHELIQQFIAAGVPIDTAWNMFIFVHITLVGGIYAMRRRMNLLERFFVSALYSAFGWINWKALTGAYRLYDSILLDIRAAGKGDSLYVNTTQFLATHSVNDRTFLVTAIHGAAWLLVITFIATEKHIPHKTGE